MKDISEMNLFDLGYTLAKGRVEVKEFVIDCLIQKEAIHEFIYLYEKGIEGDEILQLMEEVDNDKDEFILLMREFMKGRKEISEFLYGIKYAFPLIMLGQREVMVIARENQVRSLMPYINKGEITREQLINYTEGVAYKTDIEPLMNRVEYERGHKKVVAERAILLVEKAVKEKFIRTVVNR